MRNFTEELVLWVGVWGEKIGISIALIVILWDIIWKGARHLFAYSIGVRGVIALIFAMSLIVASKHIQNKMR